jgi:archaellum component FlaC
MAGAADEEVKNQLKELEAILEESDKRIRQMVENIPNAMYVPLVLSCAFPHA